MKNIYGEGFTSDFHIKSMVVVPLIRGQYDLQKYRLGSFINHENTMQSTYSQNKWIYLSLTATAFSIEKQNQNPSYSDRTLLDHPAIVQKK